MPKIHILPEQLANQIAAGEVVERPASVVKELVENSIDAGAKRIEIDIKGGGIRAIRIADNGEGMDGDDVLLCFERHGTSKLLVSEQLAKIATLGFRGEAIPSIAAVAKMTITSRTRDNDLGTAVVSHFGSIKRVSECGARIGTIVEVTDLFGNTPARRKFLRTARTEIAHIDDTVRSIALARPDIAIIMRIDDRETIRLDSGMALAGRLAQLLNYHGEFIAINNGLAESDGILITGLLVPPDLSAPVAGRLRLLVNGRSIRDRLLTHAVGEGLRSFLLKGRYPAGVICINLPLTDVDVNVHPAKQEVRFRDGTTVHRLIGDAVRSAMLDHQQHVRHTVFHEKKTFHGQVPEEDRIEPATENPRITPAPSPGTNTTYRVQCSQTRTLPFTTGESEPARHRPKRADTEQQNRQEPIRVEDLLVIGSYRDLYLFCRNRDRLVVIDQHAAHERLLFEDLKRQYQGGRIASQQLLFPVTAELTPRQSQRVETHLETLAELGFSLRDFGDTTWVIAAVPALAGSINPQLLLIDVLDAFGGDTDESAPGVIDSVLATMACKRAVKAGDHLNDQEIEALLRRMVAADLFSHCPHGRPVVKLFDETDLKKWFSRT